MTISILEAVAYKVSFTLVLLLMIVSYKPFKYILQKKEYSKRDLNQIGFIFGMLAIISAYCTINVYGAISATRNIVIVSSTILFGRRVGIIAFIMALSHRLMINLYTISIGAEILQLTVVSVMAIIFQPRIKDSNKIISALLICISSIVITIIIMIVFNFDNSKLVLQRYTNVYIISMFIAQFGVILFMKILQIIQNERIVLEQEKEIEKLNTKIAKSELKALQAQINPHFLFNTLNAISILVKRNPEQARSLIFKLSNYLRYNLELKNGLIDIYKEIEQVKVYLEIEQVRFKNKLDVLYDIDENIDIKVPSLIIQPIVENALIHGILKSNTKGKLMISIKKHENYVRVCIANKGIPIDEKIIEDINNGKIKENKVGLSNVHNRLIYQYGKGLNINRLEDGTKIEFIVGGV